MDEFLRTSGRDYHAELDWLGTGMSETTADGKATSNSIPYLFTSQKATW
jgi:hypothetical protein